MNIKPGVIRIERKEGVGLLAPPIYSYEFDGDVFVMDRHMLMYELPRIPNLGERFLIGGEPFIATEYSLYTQNIVAIKEKRRLLVLYFLISRPITRTLRLIYQRMIITLAVWNLAEVHMGEIPSLECIRRRWRKS